MKGKKGETPFSKKRKRGTIGNNMRKHMGTHGNRCERPMRESSLKYGK
jgi:hypothetical protein